MAGNVSARIASARELRTRLADLSAPGSFSEAELEGLPDPVRRYFEAAVVQGTPLATSAHLRMVGSIKLGERWAPFRARQIEAPHHGFAWSARAGLIVGSDRYADGHGAMNWRVLGLVRVMHADGPDISRSAAGRVGAEAVWVPTALLPRFGVTWTATDPHHVTASYRLDEVDIELHYTLGDDARVRSVVFDRWGDPDNTGTLGQALVRVRGDRPLDLRRRHDPQLWSRRLVLRDRPVGRRRVLPVRDHRLPPRHGDEPMTGRRQGPGGQELLRASGGGFRMMGPHRPARGTGRPATCGGSEE